MSTFHHLPLAYLNDHIATLLTRPLKSYSLLLPCRLFLTGAIGSTTPFVTVALAPHTSRKHCDKFGSTSALALIGARRDRRSSVFNTVQL
jgi:hypothetical protein